MSVLSRVSVLLAVIMLLLMGATGAVVAGSATDQAAPADGEGGAQGGPENPPIPSNQTQNTTSATAAATTSGITPVFSQVTDEDQPARFRDTVTLEDGSTLAVGRLGYYGDNSDGLAMRIAENGSVLWKNQYGSFGSEQFWGAAPTPDGGALLVGDTNSAELTGGGESYDGYVVKIGADGSVQGTETYGGENDEWLSNVVATDYGYLLVGERHFLASGETAAWALSIDDGGSILESHLSSDEQGTDFHNVVSAGEAGYIAVGSALNSAGDATDSYVAKLGAGGEFEQTNTFGSVGSDVLLGAATNPDGELVVNGYTTESENPQSTDVLSARIDPDSTHVLGQATYGDDEVEYSGGITHLGGTFVTTTVTENGMSIETLSVENGVRETIGTVSASQAGYHLSENGAGNLVVAGWALQQGSPEEAWVGGYELPIGSPTASFTYTPEAPTTTEQITFDASATDAGEPISSYRWDFNNDGETDATGVTATHQYETAGTYPVSLTVVDENGATDTTTQSVTVTEPATSGATTTLDPDTISVTQGGTTTVDLVVEDVGDIAAYNFNLSVSDDAGVTISDIALNGGSAVQEVNIASDGQSANASTAAASIDGTNGATLATITLTGANTGTATLNATVNLLADADANEYELAKPSATAPITVGTGPGDVSGNGNAATDPDNDGVYEDVNGDGSANIVDVQALFSNLDSDSVTETTAFDINGDGTVNVIDVQALLTEL